MQTMTVGGKRFVLVPESDLNALLRESLMTVRLSGLLIAERQRFIARLTDVARDALKVQLYRHGYGKLPTTEVPDDCSK